VHSELLTRLATFAAELMWLGLVAAPSRCTTLKPLKPPLETTHKTLPVTLSPFRGHAPVPVIMLN